MSDWSALFSSAEHTWATPPKLVQAIEKRLGWIFDIDAAALPSTAVCERYIAPPGLEPLDAMLPNRPVGYDALSEAPWAGHAAWLNPPYGRSVGDFLRRAVQEVYGAGPVQKCAVLTFLRSDTRWWHEVAWQAQAWLVLKGRVRFEVGGVPQGSAPAPSVVLVYDRGHDRTLGPTVLPMEWQT